MKKIFLFIMILLISFLAEAQSVVEERASEKERVSEKKAAIQSLNQIFESNVLEVYQENSKSKVEDLFSYFQMLTDASLTNDLKKEVVKNINLVFNNQNPMVIDITSESFDIIELGALIQKLLISEPILFKVSSENRYNSVTFNSWKNSYHISITKSGLTKTIGVSQTVFMHEAEKQFGSGSKEVWVTYLGEISSIK